MVINNTTIMFIVAYQKLISPHKSFCCAHRAKNGKLSCSSWAIKILEKQKLSLFIPLMKRRFIACNEAHKEIQKENKDVSNNSDTVDPCPCGNKKTAKCCLVMLPFPWFS